MPSWQLLEFISLHVLKLFLCCCRDFEHFLWASSAAQVPLFAWALPAAAKDLKNPKKSLQMSRATWIGSLTCSELSSLERRPEGACWFFFSSSAALLSTSRSLFASTSPTLGSGSSLSYLVGCFHLAPSHLWWIDEFSVVGVTPCCIKVALSEALPAMSHQQRFVTSVWAFPASQNQEWGVLQRGWRAGVTGTELDMHTKVFTGSPKVRKRCLVSSPRSGLQESGAKRVSATRLSREWGLAAPGEMGKAGPAGETRLLIPAHREEFAEQPWWFGLWPWLRVGVQLCGVTALTCPGGRGWQWLQCVWITSVKIFWNTMVEWPPFLKLGWKESTAQLGGFSR